MEALKIGDTTFKEDVGGKKCFQIDKKQSIDIVTTPGIKKYTMIFNVYYENTDSWKTLVDIADQSDSALFIKPTTGVFGISDIGYSDFSVPSKKWCKIAFTYDADGDIISHLIYKDTDNDSTVRKTYKHGTDDKDIPAYFTLTEKAKLFYDKSGDDDTIYTNYFKLIENRLLTVDEIEGLDPDVNPIQASESTIPLTVSDNDISYLLNKENETVLDVSNKTLVLKIKEGTTNENMKLDSMKIRWTTEDNFKEADIVYKAFYKGNEVTDFYKAFYKLKRLKA